MTKQHHNNNKCLAIVFSCIFYPFLCVYFESRACLTVTISTGSLKRQKGLFGTNSTGSHVEPLPASLLRPQTPRHRTSPRPDEGCLSSSKCNAYRQVQHPWSRPPPWLRWNGTVLPVSQLVAMETQPTSLASHPDAFCTHPDENKMHQNPGSQGKCVAECECGLCGW